MFTSSPTRILCWEDSWKWELISHPPPQAAQTRGLCRKQISARDHCQYYPSGWQGPATPFLPLLLLLLPWLFTSRLQHRAGPIQFFFLFFFPSS